MVLSKPEGFPDPAPGSFLHMAVPTSGRFFLRRPFSIFDCNGETITLLIVEKGEGTRILRELGAGETVDFLGPLGEAFPLLPGQRILAVAGGVGLAPLYYYQKFVSRTLDKRVCPECYQLVYGGRSEEDLFLSAIDLADEGSLLATDDGSYGFRGNAAQLAEVELERNPVDALFSCGPTPMLKAVADLAVQAGIAHWVSLENRMACAVGACRSCVIPVSAKEQAGKDVKERYKTVCHDGPVFNANEVIWERLPEP